LARFDRHHVGKGAFNVAPMRTVAPPTAITVEQIRDEDAPMPDVTIVYWRDIPAQVIVGKGRRAAKVQLPERFEQAIDRAAMKDGAAGSDDYLAGFRKADPYPLDGDQADIAAAEASRLDAEYDKARLITLIENGGKA
jgi:hypothetical protein